MEPEDALNAPTVYKYDQILTKDDLITFYENLEAVYEVTPKMFILERDRLMIALRTVDTLINWIDKGKNRGAVFEL